MQQRHLTHHNAAAFSLRQPLHRLNTGLIGRHLRLQISHQLGRVARRMRHGLAGRLPERPVQLARSDQQQIA